MLILILVLPTISVMPLLSVPGVSSAAPLALQESTKTLPAAATYINTPSQYQVTPQQDVLIPTTESVAPVVTSNPEKNTTGSSGWTLTEWGIPTPSSGVWHVALDSGDIWFLETTALKVGLLTPSTGAITEWSVTSPRVPDALNGLAVDSSGKAWFSVNLGNQICRLDPAANEITRWTIPYASSDQNSSGPTYFAVDSSGMVWFDEYYQVQTPVGTGPQLGRLDPSTGTLTEWKMPITADGWYDVAADGSGNAYFATTYALGRLDPAANVFTIWWKGPQYSDYTQYVMVDFANGSLYATAVYPGTIVRLNPQTNAETEWSPWGTAQESLFGLDVDSYGKIFVSSASSGEIGVLDPTTNSFTTWSLAPSSNPGMLHVDPAGRIFIGENGLNAIGCLSMALSPSGLKVAMIVPITAADHSWSYQAEEQIHALQEKYGFQLSISENEADEGLATPVVEQYAATGYNIIILQGLQYQALANDVAPKYPNILFVCVDCSDVSYPNVYRIGLDLSEGGFVVGTMAGMVTRTNTLGLVGGGRVVPIWAAHEGFMAGALYADPTAPIFMNKYEPFAWSDASGAQTDATAEYSNGADVVFSSGDGIDVGVFSAAIQRPSSPQVWASNAYSNLTAIDPSANGILLASIVVNWEIPFERVLLDFVAGGLSFGHVNADMQSGAVRVQPGPGLPLAVRTAGLVLQSYITQGTVAMSFKNNTATGDPYCFDNPNDPSCYDSSLANAAAQFNCLPPVSSLTEVTGTCGVTTTTVTTTTSSTSYTYTSSTAPPSATSSSTETTLTTPTESTTPSTATIPTTSTSSIPSGTVSVGVKAGDYVKIEYSITGAPTGSVLPVWLRLDVLGVQGSFVSLKVTMHMSDGTEQNATVPVDVSGQGGGSLPMLAGGIIPANSKAGDTLTLTGMGSVTIAGEDTRSYAGSDRPVVYASLSQSGAQLTYYWDKQTGILVEAEVTSGSMSATAKAMETNMWSAGSLAGPSLVGFPFYLILGLAAVAVLAGFAVLMRRRKSGAGSGVQAPTPSPT